MATKVIKTSQRNWFIMSEADQCRKHKHRNVSMGGPLVRCGAGRPNFSVDQLLHKAQDLVPNINPSGIQSQLPSQLSNRIMSNQLHSSTQTMASTNSSLPKGWPALVLFGDSITEGIWHYDSGYSLGAALTEKFSRRIQVLERGFSGYNSSNARVIVDDVIPPAGGAIDLKLLLVFFGANDAVLPPNQQVISNEQAEKGVIAVSQHVDIEEYKDHLRAIAQHKHVKDHGAKVILVTPPPICEHKILPWKDRRSAVAKQYAEAAISVAEETGVEVLKLWQVFMEAAGWKEGEPLLGEIGVPKSEKLGELLSDGLHLTPKGYKLYFDSLMKLLEDKLPEIYNYERIFPNWGEAPRYQKPDN